MIGGIEQVIKLHKEQLLLKVPLILKVRNAFASLKPEPHHCYYLLLESATETKHLYTYEGLVRLGHC